MKRGFEYIAADGSVWSVYYAPANPAETRWVVERPSWPLRAVSSLEAVLRLIEETTGARS